MAGIFAERSGVIDFSLEGKMLMAAFVAAVGSYLTTGQIIPGVW